MKLRVTSRVLAAALFVLTVHAKAAAAADVNVLCSVGIKAVMEALAPEFERATKNKVTVKYDLAATLKKGDRRRHAVRPRRADARNGRRSDQERQDCG